MDKRTLRARLDEYAANAFPADVDLWPPIRQRVQAHPRRYAGGAPLSSPPRTALLALLLVAAFGTAAALATPALDDLFSGVPALGRFKEDKLYHPLNLSQTANGYTVTVNGAYADPNLIMLVYTVGKPAGGTTGSLLPAERQLTDERGTVFNSTIGGSAVGGGALGADASVVYFSAAGRRDIPPTLNLRLVLTLAQAAPTGEAQAIAPPFSFDFSLPVTPGKIVEIEQTTVVAGVPVTLRRVVVAPSETRAILCFTPGDGQQGWGLGPPTLTGPTVSRGTRRAGIVLNGQETVTEYALYEDRPIVPGEHCAIYHFPHGEMAATQAGPRTLTIEDMFTSSPPNAQVRLAGPWVFRFDVP